MSKRRTPALLLLSVAGIGWVATWERSAAEPSNAADATVKTTVRSVAPEVGPTENAAPQVVHFWTGPTTAVPAPHAARPAVSLGADATVALGEQVALQALAEKVGLELSPRQWTALAAATAHIQAVRQAYEASIAKVERLGDGRYRMEIPAYPAAGDALREKFQAELRAHLGDASVSEIMTQLGGELEGHFGGFGVSVQTLEFAAARNGVEADYQVTRTVHYWNAVAGENRLTTRRETHFPGLEDPSGHAWGPFLTALASKLPEPIGG